VISVCMTTYNGIAYIEQQLNSILNQLSSTDEVLIFDDKSTDGTYEFLVNFSKVNSIVKVKKNPVNLGYVKNFEQAIYEARGDIIYLSDQDDIWNEDKVKYISDFFNDEMNSNVDILHHGMETISSDGNLLDKTFNYVPPSFNQKNYYSKVLLTILKPKCYGCAMAFRKKIVPLIVPFPKQVYSHDHWLNAFGVVSSNLYFDDKVLISYRQHNNNLSPKKGLTFLQKIKIRTKFIKLLYLSYLRLKV